MGVETSRHKLTDRPVHELRDTPTLSRVGKQASGTGPQDGRYGLRQGEHPANDHSAWGPVGTPYQGTNGIQTIWIAPSFGEEENPTPSIYESDRESGDAPRYPLSGFDDFPRFQTFRTDFDPPHGTVLDGLDRLDIGQETAIRHAGGFQSDAALFLRQTSPGDTSSRNGTFSANGTNSRHTNPPIPIALSRDLFYIFLRLMQPLFRTCT
jgi:hypothetical protein